MARMKQGAPTSCSGPENITQGRTHTHAHAHAPRKQLSGSGPPRPFWAEVRFLLQPPPPLLSRTGPSGPPHFPPAPAPLCHPRFRAERSGQARPPSPTHTQDPGPPLGPRQGFCLGELDLPQGDGTSSGHQRTWGTSGLAVPHKPRAAFFLCLEMMPQIEPLAPLAAGKAAIFRRNLLEVG